MAVSEHPGEPRSAEAPPWEGRVGKEFRGALAAGMPPASDVHTSSSSSSNPAPSNPVSADPPAPPSITTVSPSLLRVCLPWWRDLDVSDQRAVGRWGEALVYQYMLQRYPGWRVTWLNEQQETSSFHDIKLESPVGHGPAAVTVFAEVKTTRWPDRNAFELSPWEWDFAQRPGVSYHIYRVYSAGDPRAVRITVVRDPARLVREHAISMCLAI